MLITHLFDLLPIWALLILTLLIMVLFIEYGFRLGRHAKAHANKAQTSQVRAIMGAGLGLLAFMLAFTFSTAQSHFEARVQSLAEESRIVRNAFMQADLLPDSFRFETKHLLKDYMALRAGVGREEGRSSAEEIAALLKDSEKIQRALWELAVNIEIEADQDEAGLTGSTPFTTAVLALFDIHYTRLHAAVMNRIPFTIWMTLYLMAALSMVIMGYQAGLTGKRSPVATITLAVAFSAVIILISDLDRPVMSFFKINDQLLVDLYEYMEADLSLEYYPGD